MSERSSALLRSGQLNPFSQREMRPGSFRPKRSATSRWLKPQVRRTRRKVIEYFMSLEYTVRYPSVRLANLTRESQKAVILEKEKKPSGSVCTVPKGLKVFRGSPSAYRVFDRNQTVATWMSATSDSRLPLANTFTSTPYFLFSSSRTAWILNRGTSWMTSLSPA